MTLLAEIAGEKCYDNLANMDLPDIPLICSYTEQNDNEGVYVGHCG